MFDFFKKKSDQEVLREVSEEDLRVEAARRGSSFDSSTVVPDKTAPNSQTIKIWKAALAQALNPEDPRRANLIKQYYNALYDATLQSTITTRQLRVVRTQWKVIKDGEHIPELSDLFRAPWFDDIMRFYMTRFSHGTGVIELHELNDDLSIKSVRDMPRSNVIPEKGLILKEQDDESGFNYKDPKNGLYFLQIGADNELGLLEQAVPLVLAKKFALGAWQVTQERFGVPFLYVNTASNDKKRRTALGEVLKGLGIGGWAIFNKDEELKTLETSKADPHKIFDECITRINSEIAKLVLGTDTVNNMDSSGTYGSMQILNEVSDDRHWSDVEGLKNWLNTALIPRLVEISPYYKDLDGCFLEPDLTKELTPKEFLDGVIALGGQWELDPEEISSRLGITLLAQKENEPEPDFKKNEEPGK